RHLCLRAHPTRLSPDLRLGPNLTPPSSAAAAPELQPASAALPRLSPRSLFHPFSPWPASPGSLCSSPAHSPSRPSQPLACLKTQERPSLANNESPHHS